MPFFGILADRVGYRKFLYVICYVIIISVYPIFLLMVNPDHNFAEVFLGAFLFSLLASAICAPAYPYAISAFAPEIRYSGVAVSWNIGVAIFGGTTPAISSFLSGKVASYAPSFYIIGMCIAFVIVSFITRKDKH
jgi:MHS family proline/betaine transporter-like MFS transporter